MRPLILITNDDGVSSPGLAAVALAVHDLGDLLIVAPREQQTSMGRSYPRFFDGRLTETTVAVDGHKWAAYAVTASPAQAVQHAILELADRRPALVISGINYGENIGVSIAASGTIGAAMEAGEWGIPSLAVSLEVHKSQHYNNDPTVKFDVAAHFTRYFAQRWLNAESLPDVDLLKIDVPAGATTDTPWRVTRLERKPYYVPLKPERTTPDGEGRVGYEVGPPDGWAEDSDASALRRGEVSVTPISLDATSRIAQARVRSALNGAAQTDGD